MLVHLKTLGCRLNEAELETWAQAFQQQGHAISNDAKQANLIVINSCAVTGDAARKSRNLIRRVHRDNPQAKLIVSGCYATLNEAEAAEIMGVDLVVSNRDKDQLVQKALTDLDLSTMPSMSTEPGEHALFSRGKQRAFIKVQDGCRYRCTFCIVTVARGEERSRSIAEVVAEVNALSAEGIQEIVLTGVHLGGYGSDLGLNLNDLVRALLDQTSIQRIRLGSLEPWELSENFYELFLNPRVMPHLHLPLQSGSDSVLRRMARRCKTEEFRQIVQRLRAIHPDFNVTSDIIVGFPGETEEEWRESFEFIQDMNFGHLHIFSYSERQGTKAATLPNKVPEIQKKQRSQALHDLAAQAKQAFYKQQITKTFPVLWEGSADHPDSNGLVFGYAPNYLKIACPVPKDRIINNSISLARIKEYGDEVLLAELC